MPADLESMVYANAVPWHGLGTKIDDAVSFHDGFKQAGLDWEVEVRPMFLADGSKVEDGRAVVRTTDNKQLGVVGTRWTPLQNRDAFNVFEPLVARGDMTLETAGSLKGGKRIWVLCKIKQDNLEVAKNDEIALYGMLSNGHDGTLAVHFGFTNIRIVCSNTEQMARTSESSRLVRVRHHRLVLENVEKLRDLMNLAKTEFEGSLEDYRFLASRAINQDDLKKYIRIVFKQDKKKEDDISSRQNNIMAEVERLFEEGKGNDLPGVRGTYWAAYNSVTEYLNWNAGRNAENRMNSLWFGPNNNVSRDALLTAMEMADATSA